MNKENSINNIVQNNFMFNISQFLNMFTCRSSWWLNFFTSKCCSNVLSSWFDFNLIDAVLDGTPEWDYLSSPPDSPGEMVSGYIWQADFHSFAAPQGTTWSIFSTWHMEHFQMRMFLFFLISTKKKQTKHLASEACKNTLSSLKDLKPIQNTQMFIGFIIYRNIFQIHTKVNLYSPHKAVNPFCKPQIHHSLQQRAQKRNSLQLKMDEISPRLAVLKNSVIPMPGLTTPGQVW